MSRKFILIRQNYVGILYTELHPHRSKIMFVHKGYKFSEVDSNDNGVRLVNFATSKNLVVKSTMFPHRNIRKYTWTSPDGYTHNQIDHVLINRRRHSSLLDVRSFRGADCDSDQYLVVAKLRERLAVNKKAAQKFEG